jgi:hypothetical protein
VQDLQTCHHKQVVIVTFLFKNCIKQSSCKKVSKKYNFKMFLRKGVLKNLQLQAHLSLALQSFGDISPPDLIYSAHGPVFPAPGLVCPTPGLVCSFSGLLYPALA